MSRETTIQITPGQHTLTEILSQPRVWEQTLADLGARNREDLPNLTAYDQILFTGCGSTHYLALWAARECQRSHDAVARAAPASDLWLHGSTWVRPGRPTLLVAISRSGETSETMHALEAFRAAGHGDTLAVTCYPCSELARACRWVIDIPAAQEESIAQTRSFTSMMLAVAWLLAPDQAADSTAHLVAAGERLLRDHRQIAVALGRQRSLNTFFYLGGGSLFGLASEAMLKTKEMSLCHAEAFHFLEFRHGPMSLVAPGSLVIGLMSEAEAQERKVLADMRALGASTLALAPSANPALAEVCDTLIPLEESLPEVWRAPLYLPLLHLMAYERALAVGLDPDRPTHLEAVVKLDE